MTCIDRITPRAMLGLALAFTLAPSLAAANYGPFWGGGGAVTKDLSTTKIMTTKASGTFDVKMTPVNGAEDTEAAIGRFTIDKQYHGDLEATARGQMLSSGNPQSGSAGYVAIEVVSGKLNGKEGSFALQHSGTMHQGSQSLVVSVVPGSGTGALAGISGTLEIIIEGKKHSYVLTYSLPNSM